MVPALRTVTITETVDNGKVVVTASAFGLHEVIFKTGITGKRAFKIEVDRGNKVEGTVEVLSDVPAAAGSANG